MLELEMILNCPKHVTSQCPILFKILLCYWCCCWVCLQSVDGIVGRVALCDLSRPISCWRPPCWPGLSVCDADWLAYLSICTRLAWVCLCTRALNAREKVDSHASSQLALHVIISLPQHDALWSPELFWNSWSRTSLVEILYLTNTHQELCGLSSGLLYVDKFKTWRSHSLRKTIWIILHHCELKTVHGALWWVSST